MTLADRQPQVDGALDGIPAAVTIDTGSVAGAEVYAPFVSAHDLVARYHAVPAGLDTRRRRHRCASFGSAGRAASGRAAHPQRPAAADRRDGGAEANPTVAINLGDLVLRRFTLLLDYRRGTIRFDTAQKPRARPSATPAAATPPR